MKKLILIIAVLLGNCVSQSLDVPEFETILEANEWIHNNIKTKLRSDFELLFIQSPETTLEKKTGVCSDRSLLLMKIIYINTGVKTKFVSRYDDGYYRHALVYDGTNYYDPSNGTYSAELNVEYYTIDYDYMIIGDP